MWKDTAITRRLKLSAPIIQGPFGSGLSSVDLAVAVGNCGGLGSFGAHHLEPGAIREVAAAIRARTPGAFALNLWVPYQDSEEPKLTIGQWHEALELLRPWFDELRVPLPDRPERFTPRYEDQVEAVIELKPPVFSFVFGVPEAGVLERCRRAGIITAGAATTPREARLLAEAGVDMLVATGMEAGGHRVSFLDEPENCLTGTLALVPSVVDAVRVPVIAAGGIADTRGMSAAIALGASAVQIGTAFLACEESNASALHRHMLFSEAAGHTTLTRAFTGRLARGIHNEFVERLRAHESRLPTYPVQAWLTGRLRQAAIEAGRRDVVSLWAGQAAGQLRHRSAAGLFRALATGSEGRTA